MGWRVVARTDEHMAYVFQGERKECEQAARELVGRILHTTNEHGEEVKGTIIEAYAEEYYTNFRVAPGTSQSPTSSEQDYVAYDTLPRNVRFELQQTNMDFLSSQLIDAINFYGVEQAIQLLRGTERNDIYRVARQYEREYKIAYPHTTANASVQRYGQIIPKQRHRTRMTTQVLRRMGYPDEI